MLCFLKLIKTYQAGHASLSLLFEIKFQILNCSKLFEKCFEKFPQRRREIPHENYSLYTLFSHLFVMLSRPSTMLACRLRLILQKRVNMEKTVFIRCSTWQDQEEKLLSSREAFSSCRHVEFNFVWTFRKSISDLKHKTHEKSSPTQVRDLRYRINSYNWVIYIRKEKCISISYIYKRSERREEKEVKKLF
jgi:hypothetical protein